MVRANADVFCLRAKYERVSEKANGTESVIAGDGPCVYQDDAGSESGSDGSAFHDGNHSGVAESVEDGHMVSPGIGPRVWVYRSGCGHDATGAMDCRDSPALYQILCSDRDDGGTLEGGHWGD